MEELISVIIPVYNVEKYVEDCIRSVINQTYRNIEIIVINDGSTDDSKNICESMQKKEHRIQLFSQENYGLSVARNKGIEAAHGKWITFVDSDDILHPSIIEILYKGVIKYHVEVSSCGLKRFRVAANTEAFESIQYEVVDKFLAIENTMKSNSPNYAWGTACGKLYSKRLFQKIRYPEGRLYEDNYVIYKLYDKVDSIVYCKNDLYYYRINERSITAAPRITFDEIDGYEERYKYFFDKGYMKLYDIALDYYLNRTIDNYFLFLKKRASKECLVSIIKRFKISYQKKKEKRSVKFFLFNLCPILEYIAVKPFEKMIAIYKRG